MRGVDAAGECRAVFAFPLQIGAARLGMLDRFRRHTGPLTSRELPMASSFADVTVEAILNRQHDADGDDAVESPAAEVEHRAQLFQALGMVLVQLGVSRDCGRQSQEVGMTVVSAERLAEIFVEVADTLVDDFDLIDFLHMLADRATDLVGAAAAGLVLADARGRLQYMAGSAENVKPVELFQLQDGEGPCLDAIRTGQAVIDVDLGRAAGRWPRFAPRATAAGFQSVHAFPLRLRHQTIGAMNVFGATRGGDFTGADVPIMQALADVAAISLLQERAIHRGGVLTEQLQGALNTRIVIEQAKGAVAQARGITVDEAFALIRGHARSHHRKLTELAHAIVAGPEPADRILTP